MTKIFRTKEGAGPWRTSQEFSEADSGYGGGRGPIELRADTPGLDTGVELFTPVEGELLLFVLAENPEMFDGQPNVCYGQGVEDGGYGESFSPPGPNDPVGGMAVLSNELRTQRYLLSGVPLEAWMTQDDTKGGPAIEGTAGLVRLWFVVLSSTVP